MLIDASKLLHCPVMSLHVGGQIAEVVDLIVDPNNLKLIACQVDGVAPAESGDNILRVEDIREFSRLGMIVDSADDFAGEDDIIQVQKVRKLNFSLLNLHVETVKKSKLGKVSDYIINTETWQVHQLVVHRPILKALIDPELIIPCSDIIEVTDYKVIVRDEHLKAPSSAPVKSDFVPNFVNPFRKTDLATEAQPKDTDS